ncbi:MAG TPA: HNH endonuclease signature motif containing protein [Anaeromyxobacter sp.]
MTSARDLSAHLAELLHRERAALAEFLVALADFDRKRLWIELGHASLFYFLHRELGLSKGAAYYRKTAAELIQKFPEIVEPLRDGRLCFTSVVELSKVLTPENRSDVLPRFFQLSKREAKAVSAALHPVETAPHRDVVTSVRVPVAASGIELVLRAEAASDRVVTPGPGSDPLATAPVHLDEPPRANSSTACRPPPRAPRFEVEPLTANLSRLHVTVSRGFLEKLDATRAALSHSHPGAGGEELLEAGLDLLLERHAKRKGLVAKPRREPPPATTSSARSPTKADHVSAHVKRAVWKRDGGRCQWPIDGGGVCGSTHQVELDHVVPRGRGGPPTLENMRCLCRTHNQLAARQVYGDEWMDRFTRGGTAGESVAVWAASRRPERMPLQAERARLDGG